MSGFARGALLIALAVALPFLAHELARAQLAAFDQRWPAARLPGPPDAPLAGAARPARAQVEALAREVAASQRVLLSQLEALRREAEALAPDREALLTRLAERPPLSAPSWGEVLDADGRCLAWVGASRRLPAIAVSEPLEGLQLRLHRGLAGSWLIASAPLASGRRVIAARPAPTSDASGGFAGLRVLAPGEQPPLDDPVLCRALHEAPGGERWLLSAPTVERESAREELRRRGQLWQLIAAGLCALTLLGLGARALLSGGGGARWRRLLIWCLASAALALAADRLEARFGWLAGVPGELSGERFYSDRGHALERATGSPLALGISLAFLLAAVAGARELLSRALEGSARPSGWLRLLGGLAALATWLAALFGFGRLVARVVEFSYGVVFFPPTAVLPHSSALVLEGCLFLAALATLAAGDALVRGLAAAVGRRRGELVALALGLAGAPLLERALGCGLATAAYLIALSWFVAALGRGLRGYRLLARALVALLASAALCFPLLWGALEASRLDRARVAVESWDNTPEVIAEANLELELDRLAERLAKGPPVVSETALQLRVEQARHYHLRLLRGEQLASELAVGMPPEPSYRALLTGVERAPAPGLQRAAVGRDQPLTLLADRRDVETPAGPLRIVLLLPVIEDPLLPVDAYDALRILRRERPLQRRIAIADDGEGRRYGPPAASALALPAPGELDPVRARRLDVTLDGERVALFLRREGDGLLAIGAPLPGGFDQLLAYVRILLLHLAFGALALPLWLASWLLGGVRRRTLTIERRILLAFLLVSYAPLLVLAVLHDRRERLEAESQSVAQLRRALTSERDGLAAALETDRMLDDALASERVRDGGTLFVYRDGELVAASHRGLVELGAVRWRPPLDVRRALASGGQSVVVRSETFAGHALQVGYGRLLLPERTPLLLATIGSGRPEAQRAEQVRATLSLAALYGLALVGVIFAGLLLARRISQPLEKLLAGTREIARGNLTHQIDRTSDDEFGELVESFNTMISQIQLLQEQRVDAGRSEVMSTMARQIAHEIKNPLTPMKLSVQLLRDAYDKDHPRLGEIVERTTKTVIEQIEALRRIATSFSQFVRFPERDLAPVDVEVLLEDVAQMYDAYEGRIEVVRRLAGGLDPVLADKDELRRVLINLLTNAVQAIEGEGRIVLISGRSLLAPVDTRAAATAEPRPCVEIKVLDSGGGIAPEHLDKIFVPNFSTKSAGTGLGLPICKKVIHELGGSIAIESVQGQGTTVSLQLPVARGDRAEPASVSRSVKGRKTS